MIHIIHIYFLGSNLFFFGVEAIVLHYYYSFLDLCLQVYSFFTSRLFTYYPGQSSVTSLVHQLA